MSLAPFLLVVEFVVVYGAIDVYLGRGNTLDYDTIVFIVFLVAFFVVEILFIFVAVFTNKLTAELSFAKDQELYRPRARRLADDFLALVEKNK